MRITNRAMNNNLLMNLNSGLGRLDKLNRQLGSKKQISVPSDDPVKAGVILRTSSSIRETEQYIRNNDAAASWLDASDIVFKDVIAVIHRAKELANRGASTHLDETSRKALADEVAQLHDQMLQLANSTHGGRYLFAGQKTQTKPFVGGEMSGEPPTIQKVTFHGDEGSVEFEIGANVKIGVNVQMSKDDNENMFGQIFSTLQNLHKELINEPTDGEFEALNALDANLDRVLQEVSHLGGKQNRVELAQERLKDLKLNVTQILSEAQDLDYAEAIMELKMEEFAYRTALSVGARIIQPSLIDFLR